MTKCILVLLGLMFGEHCLGQKQPIEIINDTLRKRINLYATNTSEKPLEMMLIIEGNGFRRSSFKPLIKTIAPKDTILATTLIPLVGVDYHYSYHVFSDPKFKDVNIKHIKATDLDLQKAKQFSDQKKVKDSI